MSGMKSTDIVLGNCRAEELDRVPDIPFADFRQSVIRLVAEGAGVSALFARPETGGRFRFRALLRENAGGSLRMLSAVGGPGYPSMTPECPAVHLFERDMAERWGIRPEGHPWLKPVRFPRSGAGAGPECGDTGFFSVDGEEVHEVAVGPVHAGVIEPGHFRFQCHGENVLHLEISLGFQHRDVLRSLERGPDLRSIHYAGTLAGDTSVGHATAYCQALEALAGCAVPPRAQAIRGIALELERIANHVGDLGALAGDIGFLPTASWCGRIRGDVLNLTALLCGSRFGRALVRPGGVGFDLDERTAAGLDERLSVVLAEARIACDLLWKAPSVGARFEETGRLARDTALEIGLVGPAARACGIEQDVRRDFPSGIYRFAHIPVSTWRTGDVFARAYVRWLETQRSISFIKEQLRSLPPGELRVPAGKPAPGRIAVSLVEGWRGEICHAVATGPGGEFSGYEVVDPSFHNWFGLALAMRDQQISDFPLCNKSFNLSYCGHDL
jgi:Ni,Fe-hydrogenase III large subunit